MSEWAFLILLAFGAICGGLMVWMVMQLRYQDLRGEFVALYEDYQATQCELEDTRVRFAEVNARWIAAEASAQWQSRLASRLSQELELERVVSDAYAAGIRQEEQS